MHDSNLSAQRFLKAAAEEGALLGTGIIELPVASENVCIMSSILCISSAYLPLFNLLSFLSFINESMKAIHTTLAAGSKCGSYCKVQQFLIFLSFQPIYRSINHPTTISGFSSCSARQHRRQNRRFAPGAKGPPSAPRNLALGSGRRGNGNERVGTRI